MEANVKDSNPKDAIGVKKAPMSSVSARVLAEVGVAMLEGNCKYGRANTRVIGVRASVYYDALMRHMFSWWEGEDVDKDSGLSHITKAISCLITFRDAMLADKWVDDRPPSSGEFYKELNEKAASLVEKYKDCRPVHYTQKSVEVEAPKEPEKARTYMDLAKLLDEAIKRHGWCQPIYNDWKDVGALQREFIRSEGK